MLLLLYLAQLRSSPLACNKYLHMSHAASASGMIAVALEAQALHSLPALPAVVRYGPYHQALMHHECTTVLRSPLPIACLHCVAQAHAGKLVVAYTHDGQT